MSEPTLTAHDAMQWNERTSAFWRQLLIAQPEILTRPCSIAKTATVAELLQHIVAVELRYAERLALRPETGYSEIPCDTVEAIYATHDRAMALYGETLHANLDWNGEMEFVTRTLGPARSTRRSVFFHAMFHSIRHYAQLATLLREHGYTLTWMGDYLAMDLRRA